MKKILISSIIFSILILAACAPAPTVTSVPSETPTIQPSSTPTATPTLEPTIEATATQPAPPVNPEYIEGIGNITAVVQRESDKKWYGINELGMAVTVQNEKGEWIPYDRPMKLAQYGGATDPLITMESLGLTEITPENVTRLRGGKIKSVYPSVVNPTEDELKSVYNEDLPFGVVLEEKPFLNDPDPAWKDWKDFTHVYVSGINRGTIDVKIGINEKSSKLLVFEIPLQFESQILLIYLPDQQNFNDGVFLAPESDNVQDTVRSGMSNHDIMTALSANNSVGDQLVIAIQMFYAQSEYTMYPYNNAYKMLLTGLKNGNAVDTDFGNNTYSRIFMPKP